MKLQSTIITVCLVLLLTRHSPGAPILAQRAKLEGARQETESAAAATPANAELAAVAADKVQALAGFDDYVRELLRQHVTGLVPDFAVESSVELFRAFTNGIVVNAVMDPAGWPASRQEALLDLAIGLILPNEGLPE